MNLDIDFYKEFILYIANNLKPNEMGICEPINPNKSLPNRNDLAEITDNEIAYLVREFDKCGLIETNQFAHQAIPMVTGLTLDGYKLAKSISDINCWSIIKQAGDKIKTISDLLSFIAK